MSLFALHLEDASGEGTRLTDAVPGGLDESETATKLKLLTFVKKKLKLLKLTLKLKTWVSVLT